MKLGSRWVFTLLFAGLVVCEASVQAAPAEKPDPERVRALVKQLDDDRFLVREQADKELRQLGKDVVPLLKKELQDPASLEARCRLEKIIDHLAPDESVLPLIRQLGANEFENREKATRELLQKGKAILPLLQKQMAKETDLEISRRLQHIIKKLSEMK